jgi:Metallo-beta-lactamase superfamily
MDHPIRGLHASTPERLPFDAALEIRSFLLERDNGNLLLYSVAGLESDAAAIEGLGGVDRHYLNHRHEAAFTSDSLAAPLYVHEADSHPVARKVQVAKTFSDRHTLDGDFEAIPTPGHTPGATAYLWDMGERRLLFTGDTIYLRDGKWIAAVLESSDRDRYVESLELIRELDFDVLVPWAATAGQPYFQVTSRDDAQSRVGAILERIRRGEDH